MLVSSGCESDYASVHGGDRSFFPIAGATWEPKLPNPNRFSGTLAVDFEAWTTGGEDTVDLAAGEHAVLDGRDFFGPAHAEVEWRVTDVTVDVRGGMRFPWGGRLEGLLGLEGEQVELEFADASEDSLEIGPVYGIQFRF